MAPESATVARWEILYRIRRRREQLSLSIPSMAKGVGLAPTYWHQVEREQRVLPLEKLQAVLEFLNFDETEMKEVVELREVAAQRRGWWTRYEALYGEEQLRLWGMEYGAEEISCFDSLLVPGLLQTEDYARALITADTAFIRQIEVQQRIDARMQRQERLLGPDALKLNAVISEAATMQETGGRDVLRGQLQRLIHDMEHGLNLRVLPFSSSSGVLFGGTTFYLLDFPRPSLPTVAWCETPGAGGIIDKPERVRDFTTIFKHILGQSLTQADSLDLLNNRLKKLG